MHQRSHLAVVLAAVAAGALGAGCHGDAAGDAATAPAAEGAGHPAQVATPAAEVPKQLFGLVVDEQERPLPAATVVARGVDTLTVDGNGRFVIDATDEELAGAEVLLTVQAANHEALVRGVSVTVHGAAGRRVYLTLRRLGEVAVLALPSVGEGPARLSLSQHDGGASIALPTGSLVLADGTPATGEVDVSLTYWHPLDTLQSVPGALVAVGEANDRVPLMTYGVMSVAVHQDGEELRVASGARVTITMTTPEVRRQDVKSSSYFPELYWLDPHDGLWSEIARVEAPTDAASLSCDTTTGVFTAEVGHLSALNVDGTLKYTKGGKCCPNADGSPNVCQSSGLCAPCGAQVGQACGAGTTCCDGQPRQTSCWQGRCLSGMSDCQALIDSACSAVTVCCDQDGNHGLCWQGRRICGSVPCQVLTGGKCNAASVCCDGEGARGQGWQGRCCDGTSSCQVITGNVCDKNSRCCDADGKAGTRWAGRCLAAGIHCKAGVGDGCDDNTPCCDPLGNSLTCGDGVCVPAGFG